MTHSTNCRLVRSVIHPTVVISAKFLAFGHDLGHYFLKRNWLTGLSKEAASPTPASNEAAQKQGVPVVAPPLSTGRLLVGLLVRSLPVHTVLFAS
jgi:hypothetical protein